MGKQVTIDVEIEQDILEKMEFIAAKHNHSVEEEIAIALTEELSKLPKCK